MQHGVPNARVDALGDQDLADHQVGHSVGVPSDDRVDRGRLQVLGDVHDRAVPRNGRLLPDRADPNKNIVFEIAPNGTLMGVFVQMTDGLSALKFNLSPTAILVPPVETSRS